ncbi:MAG: universal stress protein [Halobacteriales archaeon]
MERALVLITGTPEEKDLVRLAGELAAGVGAEVLLLHVTTEEEFADQADALAEMTQLDVTYGVEQAEEGAKQFAANVGNDVFEDVDVEFHGLGRLGDVEGETLKVAEEYGCDHLFVAGRRRSPAGKAIFGDRTQSLILNFDGPVTVTTT